LAKCTTNALVHRCPYLPVSLRAWASSAGLTRMVNPLLFPNQRIGVEPTFGSGIKITCIVKLIPNCISYTTTSVSNPFDLNPTEGWNCHLYRLVLDHKWEIHVKNPTWSPGRIRDQLITLNIIDVPSENCIKKYLEKPPPEWQNRSPHTGENQLYEFFKRNNDQTWGIDMFTVATWFFEILYVLVIIHHGSRKIIHVSVTPNPNLAWQKQQFKEATPYGDAPKYLVHDNDPIFVSGEFQELLRNSGTKSIRTAKRSPWQNPYAERVIGTIRRELFDFNVPRSQRHLEHLLKEYVHDYYDVGRTHLGLGRTTPTPSPDYPPTRMADTELEFIPLLGGLYHKLRKVA
jgi:putative transposase